MTGTDFHARPTSKELALYRAFRRAVSQYDEDRAALKRVLRRGRLEIGLLLSNGKEPSKAAAYARQRVKLVADGDGYTNENQLRFPEAIVMWGLVSHFRLFWRGRATRFGGAFLEPSIVDRAFAVKIPRRSILISLEREEGADVT